MVAIYIGLFVIRPWEQLFPWLGTVRFEFLYALVAIVVATISRKTKMPGISLQSVAVFGFFAALALSAVLGIDPSASWTPLYQYFTQIVCFCLLLMCIRSYRDLQFILAAYIGSMLLYLAKSQWEFFVHGQHRYDMGVTRLVGIENTFGGPNSLAMSIVASMPFWFYLWKTRKDALWFNTSRYSRLYRNALLAYLVLAISSTVLTNSRSGMLAMMLFVLLTVIGGKGFKAKVLFPVGGILFLMLVWAVMPEENRSRLRTVWDPESGPANAEASAQGRIDGFKAGIAMYKRFPISGVGLGNYIQYRAEHIDGVALNAHSLAGQILGETGSVGIAAFSFLFLTILLNSFLVRNPSGIVIHPETLGLKQLATACRHSLFILFFEGLFGHNMTRYNWLWIAAFVLSALTLSRNRSKEEQDSGLNRANALHANDEHPHILSLG